MKNIFSKKETEHYELMTKSGEQLLKEKGLPWQEYPRPQMRRANYQMLNGIWKLNGEDVLVPFPPQALLSGYKKEIADVLIYEKKFKIAKKLMQNNANRNAFASENNEKRSSKQFVNSRFLLHFGAVDQIAKVWVNDKFIGEHEGGYLPFYFDITDVIVDGENLIKVEAIDTLSHDYPYGKQKKDRGGMWYTPVSGIWQSVWLECVPETYIENVKLTPDLDGVDVEVKLGGTKITERAVTVSLTLHNGQIVEKVFSRTTGRIELAGIVLSDGSTYIPKHWTTDEPYLYSMTIQTKDDSVETYFALRTISIEECDNNTDEKSNAVTNPNAIADTDGTQRKKSVKHVCLNGKPIFLHGVLDQGYFPDGIYLSANEAEYEKDILRMKELGINMLRKHIKVEPEAFYYACDRLGMLVMQDMVNSGSYSFVFDTALPTVGLKKRPDAFFWEKSLHDIKGDLRKSGTIKDKRKAFFIKHSKDTIEHLYNHPSIIAYTIFNEGWGQFHSDDLYDMVKEWDSTRLVDSTSGWFLQKKNDFDSEHIYFKVIPLQVKKRPLFVSECGGYSMVVEGHHYSKDKEYGYGACKSTEELTGKIVYMYENMIEPFIKDGLCGCVYTQLSDVEDEVNGLYTYDRKVCKVDKAWMRDLADKMHKECNK